MNKMLMRWVVALSVVGPLGSSAVFAQGIIDDDGCETTTAAIPCHPEGCFTGAFEGDAVNECGGTGTTLTADVGTLLYRTDYGGEYYLSFICTDRDGNSTVEHFHGSQQDQSIFLGCGPDQQSIGDSVRIVCGPVPICATKQP